MSYKSLIQAQVAAAFDKLGDLVSTVTYVSPSAGYNPATGTITGGTEYEVRAVVAGFDLRQINGTTILSRDKQVIFAKADLTFDVDVSGGLLIEGRRYEIVAITEDPAEASLIVQVRI